MKRLFGSSKKTQPASQGPKDSILQMRSTLEMLEKKEKHLDTKIVAEVTLAKQYAVSNKSSKRISFSGTDGLEAEEDV